MWAAIRGGGEAKWPGAGARLKTCCKELNRVSRLWVPGPDEDPVEASRRREELALAGHQWAHDDQNPPQQFVRQLHCMFLAVLLARKQRDEEECPVFAPANTVYPFHSGSF